MKNAAGLNQEHFCGWLLGLMLAKIATSCHHCFGAFCGTSVGFPGMRFRVRQQKRALEVAPKRARGAHRPDLCIWKDLLWSLSTSIYVRGLALQFYVVCWWWLAAVGFWRWWHALCKARTSSPMEVSVELWVQCRGCAAFSP